MTQPKTAIDADRLLLRELNHWVDGDNPDGPTLCGLDSAGMPWTEGDVDCPMCMLAYEAGAA